MQQFSKICQIAMQMVEEKMIKLDRICREANVILVLARSYGLTGIVRVSVKVGISTFDLCFVHGYNCIALAANWLFLFVEHFYFVMSRFTGQLLENILIGVVMLVLILYSFL